MLKRIFLCRNKIDDDTDYNEEYGEDEISNEKKFFLTRDQHILKTGLAVLEFMRLTGQFTAKQIMDIAKYLAVPVTRLEKYMELYL